MTTFLAEDNRSETSQTTCESLPDGFRVFKRPYANDHYLLPCDDDEIDRLDFQHYTLRHLFHGLFISSIDELLTAGIRVLDCGCGSGRWTLDMAQDYPQSTFVGCDLVEVFPMDNIPPNCMFMQSDSVKGLPFDDNAFDFVFQRYMGLAFTPEDWVANSRELIRVAKPGAWIESVEVDCRHERMGPAYNNFLKAAKMAITARGVDPAMTEGDNLKHIWADLDDLEVDYISNPIGWGGRGGQMACRTVQWFIMSMKESVSIITGIPEEDFQKMADNIAEESKANKAWGRVPYATGRKPMPLRG